MKLKKNLIQTALVLSLLMHAFLYTLFSLPQSPTNLQPLNATTEVEFVDTNKDAELVKQNLAQRQIVEQKTINDEKPKDAKYLSEKNQSVAEETRAKNAGDFNNQIQKGKPQVHNNEEKQSGKKANAKVTLDSLKPDFDWVAVGQKKEVQKEKAGEASGNIGKQAATNDYLKDTKDGPQTILNTREFIYYSYYERIRKQLRLYWESSIKEKMTAAYKQGRYIASHQDRITKVLITLNDKGILTRVQVLEDSGLRDLDEAAIEAFRSAAPFPNPPKGIVETDGTVKIRWDFIVEA
jgi:TonB family protein